jgi:replicative DNA helicase
MSVDAEPRTRALPHDLEAEQAVLGAMLLSKDAIGDVVEIVQAGDFYRPAHVTIFATIVDLYGRGTATDPIAVVDALQTAGALGKVGGAPYLHDLLEKVPTAANAAYYAKIVAERALLRRLLETTTRIADRARAGGGNAREIVDWAQQLLHDVTSRAGEDFVTLADLLQPTLDQIETASRADATGGVPTGFADLDRLLGGLHPGQLIVVAGRPGSGKSTLAAGDFVRSAAIRHGLTTALFSLEMSRLEIGLRMLSAEAKIRLEALRTGRLSDDEWLKLARRIGEISDAPLFIDDTASISLAEIRAKARRLKQTRDLRLIVVDYLQLMTTPTARRETNRTQEVSELSRGLKLLAKELDVPVVALSQLNRGPELRADKRPMLADLRESGAIEQDSDVVIFVHREEIYDPETPRAGEADIIVAKHRNGPTDTVTVASQLHYSRFVDMAIGG